MSVSPRIHPARTTLASATSAAAGESRAPTNPAGRAARAVCPACGGRRRALLLALLLAVAVCVAAKPAVCRAYQQQGPTLVGIRVGLEDQYKVGHWTQVVLTVSGGNEAVTGTVELIAPDGDGLPARFTSRPQRFLPGVFTRVALYAKIGRPDNELLATLVDENQRELARRRFETRLEADATHHRIAHDATALLYATLGSPVGLPSLLADPTRSRGDESLAVLPSAADLPTRWYGYDGVTRLVLSSGRSQLYDDLTAATAQLEAIEQWVELGGHVILCAGPSSPELLAPGGAFAGLAPGRFERLVPLSELRALETYAGASAPIPAPPGDADDRLQVPLLVDVKGRVEVREGGVPLVIRAARGLGEVTFIGVELDDPRLRSWPDRHRLLAHLLNRADILEETAQSSTTPYHVMATYGYSDLSGQLQSALENFRGIRIAPFWLVAALVLGYIALIGPVDYFLVKRVFKRMELTWITFPLIVVVVSGSAYVLAGAMKGDQLLLSQIDLVDVDVEGQLVRGTTWFSLFSPRMAGYNLTLEPEFPEPPATATAGASTGAGAGAGDAAGEAATTGAGASRAAAPPADGRVESSQQLVSWLGLPGAGLGGMQRGNLPAVLSGRPYDFALDLDALEQVPIRVWSTKLFTSRWENRGPQVAALFDADLREGVRGSLEGRIVNRLPWDIRDALLAYDRWVYPIDELRAGAALDLGQMAGQRRDLRNELSGRSNEVSPYVRFGDAPSYDVLSRDVERVLRQMMFYAVSGGETSVELTNRYEPFVDLSGHLQLGRALLVFRGDDRAAEVHVDGRSLADQNIQHWTYYRLVLPVELPAESR